MGDNKTDQVAEIEERYRNEGYDDDMALMDVRVLLSEVKRLRRIAEAAREILGYLGDSSLSAKLRFEPIPHDLHEAFRKALEQEQET